MPFLSFFGAYTSFSKRLESEFYYRRIWFSFTKEIQLRHGKRLSLLLSEKESSLFQKLLPYVWHFP